MKQMNIDTEIRRIEDALEALETRGRNNPGGILSPEDVDERRRLVVRCFDLNAARVLYEGGHEYAANAMLGHGPADTVAAVCRAFEFLLRDLGDVAPETASRAFMQNLNDIEAKETTL